MANGLISWSTKRQSEASGGGTGMSEYKSYHHATMEIVWYCNILEELGMKQTSPVPLYTDSKAAIGTATNPVNQSKLRGLQTLYHSTRDMIEQGYIELIHVPTEEQVADIFTKPLPVKTFISLRRRVVAEPDYGKEYTRLHQREENNSRKRTRTSKA